MGHMADALEAGYFVDYRRGVLLTLHISLSFGPKDVLTTGYCSPSMLSLVCTVEPPNKGHFGDNINSAVVSFVERLSSCRRVKMYYNYRETIFRDLGLCPL